MSGDVLSQAEVENLLNAMAAQGVATKDAGTTAGSPLFTATSFPLAKFTEGSISLVR